MENNKAHLTAKTRKELSAPMQVLHLNSLIKGKALDFGCGKGFDADALGLDKYDPYFFPTMPERGVYDTVTCNYVLNVLTIKETEEALAEIMECLKPGGIAYIAVRRDKFKEGFNARGTYQRTVELQYPVLKEAKGKYIIYQVGK